MMTAPSVPSNCLNSAFTEMLYPVGKDAAVVQLTQHPPCPSDNWRVPDSDLSCSEHQYLSSCLSTSILRTDNYSLKEKITKYDKMGMRATGKGSQSQSGQVSVGGFVTSDPSTAQRQKPDGNSLRGDLSLHFPQLSLLLIATS